MAIHVYKEYLDYLNNLKKKPSWKKRSLFAFSALAITSAIVAGSSIYYINTQILPKKQAQNYLQNVKYSVVQTAQTLNDVTAIYKVAGAKTQVISTSNQSTPSALGFNTTIADIQKSIDGLESARKNIEVQKKNISTTTTPVEFDQINTQAIDYMNLSVKVLENLKSRQAFFKQMQLTIGPNLYLPRLEADNVWGTLSKGQIKDYYQKTSDEAASTIEKLANITPPAEFKSYYDAQGKYLELVRDVSDKITKILSVEDQPDTSLPSQTEKAYQLFLGAREESKNLNTTIETEKVSFQSEAETINSLAEVRLRQQALEVKLNEYAQRENLRNSSTNNLINSILANFVK